MGGPLIPGVDYAFSKPSASALAAQGFKFACRYGGAGTSDKHLTPLEARMLTAAGLSVVANVEGAASGLLNGYYVGHDWASRAHDHFVACGMPPDRPIYLSIDFDCSAAQWPRVVEALRGAADALGGVGRVGVYGGLRPVMWARRDGLAAWFWQTYAWSSGTWAPGNHIEQYRNGVTIDDADCDLNRALSIDYGQWTVGTQGRQLMTVVVHEKDTFEWYYGDGNWWKPIQNNEEGIAANAAFGPTQELPPGSYDLLGVRDRPRPEPGEPGGPALDPDALARKVAAQTVAALNDLTFVKQAP